MKLTDEDVKRMRVALIDASPLSPRMKDLVAQYHDASLLHRDVLKELAMAVATDYTEHASARLAVLLELLEGGR